MKDCCWGKGQVPEVIQEGLEFLNERSQKTCKQLLRLEHAAWIRRSGKGKVANRRINANRAAGDQPKKVRKNCRGSESWEEAGTMTMTGDVLSPPVLGPAGHGLVSLSTAPLLHALGVSYFCRPSARCPHPRLYTHIFSTGNSNWRLTSYGKVAALAVTIELGLRQAEASTAPQLKNVDVSEVLGPGGLPAQPGSVGGFAYLQE